MLDPAKYPACFMYIHIPPAALELRRAQSFQYDRECGKGHIHREAWRDEGRRGSRNRTASVKGQFLTTITISMGLKFL